MATWRERLTKWMAATRTWKEWITMLIEKIYEAKQKKIRLTPCHTNRASELGHPCERYLVLRRTRWQEAALHDVTTQLLFDEGSLQEAAVLRDLQDVGWAIVEQQRDYEWPKFQITGHLDAKVLLETEAVPIEIKSMSPWIWEQIDTLDDLMSAAQPWLRKYPAQMQLYLVLAASPRGFLILKNKATGALKELEVTIDYDYVESLLQKAERINAHVSDDTIPPPIPYDEAVCGRCPFYQRLCQPEVVRDALVLSDDAALAAQLARRAELEPVKHEFEQLDREIKAQVTGMDRVVCGNFLLLGKSVSRKEYTVKSSTYWQTTIQRIDRT